MSATENTHPVQKPPRPGRFGKGFRRVGRLVRPLIPGALLILIWELGAEFLFDPEFVGRPSIIIENLIAHIQTAKMWEHVGITFQEILAGYTLGIALGCVVGYYLGMNRTLAVIFEPYILLLNAIPKVAIAPLLIVVFGIGLASKIAIVTSLVFFLMFYAVFSGIRTIERDFLYQAQIMGAGKWQQIRYVILPAIMPNVLVGMKTSSVYAVIGAVIGEFIAAYAGIGFFILSAAGVFNVNDIWVGVIFLMFIVITITSLVGAAERRLLRWLPPK